LFEERVVYIYFIFAGDRANRFTSLLDYVSGLEGKCLRSIRRIDALPLCGFYYVSSFIGKGSPFYCSCYEYLRDMDV
jgi:hypothetical protein